MLVMWLLLYIGVLFILLQVNVYIAKVLLPRLKGYIGERRIRQLLESLGEEYIVFNDLYVPKRNGKLTQIDHVLLSPYGIFVIETKNYTGWIFGQEQQKNWTQRIYKKKTHFYNPIMQNLSHVKALKCYVEMDVPIYSIIVFSDVATLKFKEPFQQANVIQNKQLKRTIKQYTACQISSQQVSYIVQLLQLLVPVSRKQRNEIKEQHLQHVKEVTQPIKRKVVAKKVPPINAKATAVKNESARYKDTAKVDKPIDLKGNLEHVKPTHNKTTVTTSMKVCPKCGSDLVLRQGKFGAFYGCQAFPKCRYTKDW